MKNEASDEMIQYAADVCRKYNQIRILAEDAEAAWRLNLEMVAESKYPGEKEMYEQQAEEELAKYTAAREWMKLVNATVSEVREEKAVLVLRQNCLCGATMKSIVTDKKKNTYMSRSTATRYKKAGLNALALLLPPVQKRLEVLEKKVYENGA